MKKLTMMFTALLALGITGAAFAGSTIVSAYGGKGGTPVGTVVPPAQTPAGTTQHAGTLPFTGLDLTVFVGLALLLIALGILLVRSGRPNRNQV
jgi:hypothetical protein